MKHRANKRRVAVRLHCEVSLQRAVQRTYSSEITIFATLKSAGPAGLRATAGQVEK